MGSKVGITIQLPLLFVNRLQSLFIDWGNSRSPYEVRISLLHSALPRSFRPLKGVRVDSNSNPGVEDLFTIRVTKDFIHVAHDTYHTRDK